MIPVGRDQTLSRFAGIQAALQILHKLYPAITCEKFHPGKVGPLFCPPRSRRAATNFSHVIIASARVSISLKESIEVHFNRSKIFLLYFYNPYDVNLSEQVS